MRDTYIPYVKLFPDLLDALEPFGDAERGRLFTAVLVYAQTGEAPQLNGNERFLFPMLKGQIDRDRAEYTARAATSAENGRKGGRPKKAKAFSETQQNPENPVGFSKTQKRQDKDKDKDKDEDKDTMLVSNETSVKAEAVSASASPSPPASVSAYTQIQELYNGICVSFPRCAKLSNARKKAIQARLSSGYTIADFGVVFQKAQASKFLKGGNNRNWRASFDWLLCDANFAKVLDGNYDDRKGQRGQAQEYTSNPFLRRLQEMEAEGNEQSGNGENPNGFEGGLPPIL